MTTYSKTRKQFMLPVLACMALMAGAFLYFAGTADAREMAPPANTATVGEKAPDFTLVDTNGTEHSLSDFAGNIVVLEWTNHKCPYVKKHYDTGNMQKHQQAAIDNGVVWLSIISSAEGSQGYVTAEEGNALIAEKGFNSTALLMDPSGEVGHLYKAATTPHMYVVDKEGTLVYAGAIDDRPSTSKKTVEGATNYVEAAIADLMEGNAVQTATTQPYGCGVKYKM